MGLFALRHLRRITRQNVPGVLERIDVCVERHLDLLLNWVGGLLTVMLLVAGIGLMVGYSFTSSQVKSQLLEQKVFFPKSRRGTTTRTW